MKLSLKKGPYSRNPSVNLFNFFVEKYRRHYCDVNARLLENEILSRNEVWRPAENPGPGWLAGEAFHFLGDFRQTRRFRHIGATAAVMAVRVSPCSCAPEFRFRFHPTHHPPPTPSSSSALAPTFFFDFRSLPLSPLPFTLYGFSSLREIVDIDVEVKVQEINGTASGFSLNFRRWLVFDRFTILFITQ